jgi:hypothetical protein
VVGQLSSFLSSPRRRRRLVVLLVVAVVAMVVALLLAYEKNTAPSTETPVTKGKPFVPAPQPKNIRFTKSEQRHVLPVAMEFVRDAVGRKNMHSAWNISAAEIRSDTSRTDWDRGENTIIAPFPIHHARWKLDYNYSDTVGLEIAVFPEKNAEIKNPMVYYMELKKGHRGGHTQWLVDQWIPAPGSAQVVAGAVDPLAGDRSTPPAQGLGSAWLLAPLGVLALAFSVPIFLGVREWRRNRRARRTYESTLPTLSDYTSSGSGR